MFKSEYTPYLSLLNDIDYKFKIYFGLEKLEYSFYFSIILVFGRKYFSQGIRSSILAKPNAK